MKCNPVEELGFHGDWFIIDLGSAVTLDGCLVCRCSLQCAALKPLILGSTLTCFDHTGQVAEVQALFCAATNHQCKMQVTGIDGIQCAAAWSLFLVWKGNRHSASMEYGVARSSAGNSQTTIHDDFKNIIAHIICQLSKLKVKWWWLRFSIDPKYIILLHRCWEEVMFRLYNEDKTSRRYLGSSIITGWEIWSTNSCSRYLSTRMSDALSRFILFVYGCSTF